jgi:hypothetical protein
MKRTDSHGRKSEEKRKEKIKNVLKKGGQRK